MGFRVSLCGVSFSSESALFSKIKRFTYQYKNGYLPETVMQRCCDFEILETKCSATGFLKMAFQFLINPEEYYSKEDLKMQERMKKLIREEI